jgi:hypothetical protein
MKRGRSQQRERERERERERGRKSESGVASRGGGKRLYSSLSLDGNEASI